MIEKPNVEDKIYLNKCQLREYQKEIWYALDVLGYKKLISVMPRRSGKDFTIWNYAIRKAIEKPIIVFYCAPTFQQARRIVWDGLTIDGEPLLTYIPKRLIKSQNSQTMQIKLFNNSIIQCVGFNNFQESIVGTNPTVLVFSEFSKADTGDALAYASPIIAANPNAKVVVATTPEGKNHFYHLFEFAKELPDWYVLLKKTSEIKHIPEEELRQERLRLGEDMYLQEYECSFDRGASQGTYFYNNLKEIRRNGQVGIVQHDKGLLVNTSWDLGVNNKTVIVFYQVPKSGTTIRIIDLYSNCNLGIDHYVKILRDKADEYGYNYGTHYAPHDAAYREKGRATSVFQEARDLGLNFHVLPQASVSEGINKIWMNFNKFFIDDKKCKKLLEAFENYYREWDEHHQVYKQKPIHNWASDYCFVGDTNIEMSNGVKPINSIKEGMLVKTPFGLRKVLKVHVKEVKELYDVKTGSGGFTCTPNHKIFTTRGLVSVDALCYTDTLEHYNKVSSYLWKKLYGFYSKRVGLSGFKKTILSLKTGTSSSIMHMLIDGMAFTICGQGLSTIKRRAFTALSGYFTMGIYRENYKFITKTIIGVIIQLKIWSLSVNQSIKNIIFHNQALGPKGQHVSIISLILMIWQRRGIARLRAESGTSNMRKNRYQSLGGLYMIGFASFVTKVLNPLTLGLNFAESIVRRQIEELTKLIIPNVIALYAMLYSLVINTVLKRHVVQAVQVKQSEGDGKKPVKVYDLTIDQDNCYYANGYLVSNCDAIRYLCFSLEVDSKTYSKEDYLRARIRSQYGGRHPVHPFFNKDPRYDY